MELSGNTILITGGGSGIGLALAKRFLAAGSRVVACGRRRHALDEARAEAPGLETLVCDVSLEGDREQLAAHCQSDLPDLNVLINNAGIQNRPPRLLEPQDWAPHRQEIATNLEAPLHLSMLLLPLLAAQPKAHLINVSSGLAFVPLAFMPTYCLTKAALHSLTVSQRLQLKGSSVEVIEIAPPAVQTDLGGKGLHTFGEPLDEFADFAMERLAAGDLEFGYKFSEAARTAGPEGRQDLLEKLNSAFSSP